MQIAFAFWMFVLSLAPPGLDAQTDANDPPLVGQPEHFSGAVGSGFKVTMRASPVELQAGDSLVLTIHVKATGPWQRPPRRISLAEIKQFQKAFHIDPSRSELPDRDSATDRSWEFDYHLRPKSVAVKEIPALAFSYYNPRIPFPDKRWPQTVAKSIPLIVKPRAEVKSTEVQGAAAPPTMPDEVYRLAAGPDVLRKGTPAGPPGFLLLSLLLVLPPSATIGWYLLWRRRHPDEIKRMGQKRSLAAREALRALETTNAFGSQPASVMAGYLRQRLDLPAAEPTPMEIGTHLQRLGCSGKEVDDLVAFFLACDAARFSPVPQKSIDLRKKAEQLILTLESEPCLSGVC